MRPLWVHFWIRAHFHSPRLVSRTPRRSCRPVRCLVVSIAPVYYDNEYIVSQATYCSLLEYHLNRLTATDLPSCHLTFTPPILIRHLFYICAIMHQLKNAISSNFRRFMKGNQPSFTSSRSLGSVGLPFEDGIAIVMVQVLEGGKWEMGLL